MIIGAPPLPRPDFLRPVAGPGVLAWAWLATGLLVLAAAALEAHSAWAGREAALARQQAGAAQQARAATPPVLSAAALAQRAEALRWRQRLAHPWPAVWAAAEGAAAAAPGLQWLSLAHADTGGLRLAGLATSVGQAQAAAQALRQQQQGGQALWRGVTLTGVERAPEGQRFEIVASLALPTSRARLAPAGAPATAAAARGGGPSAPGGPLVTPAIDGAAPPAPRPSPVRWPALSWPVWLGSAALVAAVVLAGGVAPRWVDEQQQAEQAARRLARQAALQPPAAAPVDAAQALLRALPGADQAPHRLAALLALAERHGLVLDAIHQGPAAAGDGSATGVPAGAPSAGAAAVEPVQASLVLRGGYAALRQFVADALQQDDALLLAQLSLGRGPAPQRELSAELRWVWLQRPADSGARAGPAAETRR